jgi:hypothetical protein
MSASKRSPLARFVLLMLCLSIAGSVVAGAHYYTIGLSAQKNLQAPENAASSTINCALCRHNCEVDPDYYSCMSICNDLECSAIV